MFEYWKTTPLYPKLFFLFDTLYYFKWKIKRTKYIPHLIKRKIIENYASMFGIKNFVETGTYLGNMAYGLRKNFKKIYTIELDKKLFFYSRRRLKDYKNIELYNGDSLDILPTILGKLRSPTLFWLDAHYSGGLTKGKKEGKTAIEELKIIFKFFPRNFVALIDDCDKFSKRSFLEIENLVNQQGNLKIFIKENIIHILPEKFMDKLIRNKRFYFFIGTNAELIKISPVVREMKKRSLNYKIISSNQSKLRLKDVKKILNLTRIDYTFRLKPLKFPKNIYLRFVVWVGKIILNFIIYFNKEFGKERDNIVFIVQGDTVTTFMGSLVAKICGVKLAHIEAGLRSFNFVEPFPEELCRYIVSSLADVHFCPGYWAVNNLKSKRGVKVNTFFNTLVESTFSVLNKRKIGKVGEVKNKKYFVLVLHRQEHTLFNRGFTKKLIKLFAKASNKNLKCVFILHHLTKDFLKNETNLFLSLKKDPNIILKDRLDYPSFVNLIARSEFLATDGGSNQEEAFYLGIPCILLRGHTERMEGLGKNVLLSRNNPKIIMDFIKDYKKYKRKTVKVKKLPSKIIVDFLINY